MDLSKKVGHIATRDDLANFIGELLQDLKNNPAEWENADLASYLEAMSAWVKDMDGYFQNLGKPVPEKPDWKLFGDVLYAAKVYE